MWFGIHYGLWKTYGGTPLWLLFSQGQFGRAVEVGQLLDPWAAKHGVLTVVHDDEFAVAIDISFGEDKDRVVRNLVDRLKKVTAALAPLGPRHVQAGNA